MEEGFLMGTLAAMKWPDVKRLVEGDAVVLLPCGVLEEHGPHLPLATDVLTAVQQCRRLAAWLGEQGQTAVLAPPFHWGVCQSTGSFLGSFRVRKETATALAYDILASLAAFGFRRCVGVNAHGDIDQNLALMDAFRQARETCGLDARVLFDEGRLGPYGLTGQEPWLCVLPPRQGAVGWAEAPDVHAGDIETATILRHWPEWVDDDLARTLPPVTLAEQDVMPWLFGGQTERLSPLGYVGAPAQAHDVDVDELMTEFAARAGQAVLATMA